MPKANTSRKLFVANIPPSQKGLAKQAGGPNQQRRTTPITAVLAAAAPHVQAALKPGMDTYRNQPIPNMGGMTPQHVLNFVDKVNKANPAIATALKDTVVKAFKGQPMPAVPSNPVNDSYALSKAPNPKQVKLYSGVKPNCYTNDYMSPVVGLCEPMHVSCVKLQFPSTSGQAMADYFTKVVAFDIQTRAQANVGFDLQVSAQLSSTQILTAFNAVISALQIYYWYTSILSYESDPRNKNDAMTNLRQGITAQILSDVTVLGRRLEDTPIPPRIVEWVRYMSSNWLSGNTQGAPLIKICPNMNLVIGTIDTTAAATALTNLALPANATVFNLFRRAVPQWRINTLYDVPPIPTFDDQFVTIFSNLPFNAYIAATNAPYPTVSAVTDNINYNTFDNRLDGAAYAMGGATLSGVCYPGLVSIDTLPATASVFNTRLSYYTNAGTNQWRTYSADTFTRVSRQESYSLNDTLSSTANTPHLFGADKVQNVSINTLTQTAQNVMDYLVNIDGIPTKGSISHFSDKPTKMLRG